MARNNVPSIASLWIGPQLGTLHRLCLRSWASLGHRSVLFTDTYVANVPPGIEIRSVFDVPGVKAIYDINKVVQNPSGFSNLFRVKLLLAEPVLWLDTDMLAMREPPLSLGDHVFGFESDKIVNGAVLALPMSSPVLGELHDHLLSAKGSRIIFGDLGPRLLTRVLSDYSMLGMAAPRSNYYEIRPTELWKLYSAKNSDEVRSRLEGRPLVHLWNEATRHLPYKVSSLAPQVGSFLHNFDPEFWKGEQLDLISDYLLQAWRSAAEAADRKNRFANILPYQSRRALLSLLGRRIEAGY